MKITKKTITENRIYLELSQEEGNILREITGSVAGAGPTRDITNSIHDGLCGVGCINPCLFTNYLKIKNNT